MNFVSILHAAGRQLASARRDPAPSMDGEGGAASTNLAGRLRLDGTLAATLALTFVCFTIGLTGQAAAQSVTDPQTVEFDPSPDHWATAADGSPIVTQYNLEVYEIGSSVPYEVVSIGKPLPDADGKIRVGLAALMPSPPALVNYEARVAAVGPTGSADSDWSNVFSFTGPCTFAVAWGGQSFGAAGGSGTVGVTTGAGCSWSAAAEAGWVTLASSGSTGSGNVAFTVVPNASSLNRMTYLDVATQSAAINQAGVPCISATSPASQSFPSAGGTGNVTVTDPTGCGWTVTSNAAWITPAGGGTGSGNAAYTVASNPTSTPRTGTLTVAGNPVAIQQAALPCSYQLNASSETFGPKPVNGTVSLSTQDGCAWTAISNVTWMTVTTRSGTGSGTIRFRLANDSDKGNGRTGALAIGDQMLTVMQTSR
jgi:hypothetical protein